MTTRKKVVITTLLVVIGFSSFFIFGSISLSQTEEVKGIQQSLTQKQQQIMGVWMTVKVLNGIINVLQSAQIGGNLLIANGSINPLEVLSPIDKVLDKLSDLLLWALGAVILEKLLVSLSWFIIFKAVIPVCLLLFIITLWITQDKERIKWIIPVFCLIIGSASAAIPLSLHLGSAIENQVFTHRLSGVLADITDKGKNAAALESTVSGNGLSEMIGKIKNLTSTITSVIGNTKELGDALCEDIIQYITLFILTNIVIPILTILGIISITKYCVRVILRKNPPID